MYDIIIVGGGISGLYLYYHLINTDKKIMLLEKNSRVGGRIYQYEEHLLNEKYSFPAGAARYNKNHNRVIKLLKELKMYDKNDKGFSSAVEFIDSKNEFSKKYVNKNGFYYVDKVLLQSKKYTKEELQKYTFKEFSYKVLPKKDVEYMLIASGYSGQLNEMNMYDAYNLFEKGIRNDIQYYGGKFNMIVEKIMKNLYNNKAEIVLNSMVRKVVNIKEGYQIITNDGEYKTKQIILCIPKDNLLKLSILKPYFELLKNTITCKPLCRTYAIFKKKDIWFKDLDKKIVTNNELRYIIPMNSETGLIMISYTDYLYTQFWKKIKNNQNLLKKSIVQLVNKTFNININEPEKVYVFYWDCGVSYWNKGYNSDVVSKQINEPKKKFIYCWRKL